MKRIDCDNIEHLLGVFREEILYNDCCEGEDYIEH